MNDKEIGRGYPAGGFERVLIITKPVRDDLTVHAIKAIRNFCSENEVPWSEDGFPGGTERVLIMAVGGDGTMLAAARAARDYKKSIVCGVNTGTLGFLSDEYQRNIPELMKNISRKFGMVDERMALHGQIYIDGVLERDDMFALNEFVLAPMTIQAPTTTEVYINNEFVSKNVGSGVLVATSTGSTAMSLSSGGAIVSPSTNIMQIVPVMPHTLTSRPVITTGRDTITLKADLIKGKNHIEVYGDGRCFGGFETFHGKRIELRIKKHPVTINIYRQANWDFFNVLKEKLKW